LNRLWTLFFLSSFIAALWQWLWLGDADIFNRIIASLFEMAKLSVDIALGLVGLLALWSGLLKIAEKCGLAEGLARLLQPLFARLMPEVPPGHPALGLVSMNLAANFMGLDNAATPVGIKAMQSLQSLNPQKDTASNAQILFLVLNTSSVTLFPVTILMYRTQMGASEPASVFIPILLATAASTLVGLVLVSLLQGIRLWDRVVASWFAGLMVVIGILVFWLNSLPAEQMASVSAALGNGLLFTAICLIIFVGWRKRVAIYDEFVLGAKEGFELAVRIIPFLVAMLCAIGVLRASGILEQVTKGIATLVAYLGGDTAFVDALPTGLMRPFSGSGSRAMMLETMNSHGVDSFAAQLSAVMQGSTETTFYVLAVYFGAVGIKRVRHAMACGLIADVAGLVTAILVSYWFFA